MSLSSAMGSLSLLAVFGIISLVGFLYELKKLKQGDRDLVDTRELSLEDTALRELAREFNEPEQSALESVPLPTSRPGRFYEPLHYSRVVHYTIVGILLFGLAATWFMNWRSPIQMTGLIPLSVTLGGASLYLLFLARSSTSFIAIQDGHVWLGKNEQTVFPEQQYNSAYYMNIKNWGWFSGNRTVYTMWVFRQGYAFPPVAYFIDRFFPASNSNRQVIFFTTWKQSDGTIVADGSLIQVLLDYSDRAKLKVVYWPWLGQFFLCCLLFVGVVLGILASRS